MLSRLPLFVRIGLVCASIGLVGLAAYLYAPPKTGETPTKSGESGAVATEDHEGDNPLDSDGHIPVERVCNAEKRWETWYRWDRHEYPDGSEQVWGTIYLDECKLRDLGAGPEDEQNFIDHELGHAAGWKHWQGTPETNPAYYPRVEVTGR